MRKITNAFVNFMKFHKDEFLFSCIQFGFMFFFFISMMIPFYSASGLGITVRSSVFAIKIWWLILLVYLGGMAGFVYFTIFEKHDLVKKVLFGMLGLSGLVFFIMIISFFSDLASVPSYVDVYLSLGFLLYLVFIGLIGISIFKVQWIHLVVSKFIKPSVAPETKEVHPEQ